MNPDPRLRPGYITNGLRDHRLDDALRLIADEGFEAVGLTLDVGHLDPFRATAGEVANIATLIERLGLEVVMETGARYLLDPREKHEPTLMTRSVEGVARRVAYLERAAQIGAELGAEVVSFWTGVDHSPSADSWQRLCDGVGRASEVIRALGLEPALEPEPGMAVATMAEFTALTTELGDSAPALALDVGHLYVTEQESPADLCRRFASMCRQAHLEDIRCGVHEHLEPGEGDVDFPTVLAALAEGGYRGPVCFELSRSSHRAARSVPRCAELWRQWQGVPEP